MKSLALAFVILMAAAPVAAEPLLPLQRAVAAAEKTAGTRDAEHAKIRRETRAALSRNAAAHTAAEAREQAAAIGELQAGTALRRARQRLTEAVQAIVAEAEALEQAAALAARGEIAPSATDRLVCEGADCARVPEQQHAAMVQMGAVPSSFDATAWPPETAQPLALLALTPATPLASLRAAADAAAMKTQEAARTAEDMRTRLEDNAPSRVAYARALEATDLARAAEDAATSALRQALDTYAAVARAARRAALMAGDGYILARGGRKACAGDTCVTTEGLEAAAFLVIGAADEANDELKSLAPYVAKTADGAYVFR
jgi:colicin import membrane protein